MRALIDPRKFILVFILLTPIVNNINGFMMYRFGISALGPAFYAGMLLVLILALLPQHFQRATVLNNYLILLAMVFWFLFHCSIYGGWLSAFRSYTKFFLPFFLYRFLILYFGGNRSAIMSYLGVTVVMWGGMAVFTACFRIKPSAGEGYYGFIHGNNDYVAMLFAMFPLIRLWKGYLKTGIYYLAVLLTRSKGLLLVGVMIFLRQKSRFVRIFALLTLTITVSYYASYFHHHWGTGSVSMFQLIQFMSFGRFGVLFTLMANLARKSWLEHVFGSGFEGALLLTNGKGGVEMDIVDVYDIFGIAGLLVVCYFYYWLLYRNRHLTSAQKFNFLPLFLYSALGGHLMFNPVSNVVFTLILFVVGENPDLGSKTAERRPEEEAGVLAGPSGLS